jgi:hypothetical protein
VGATKLKRGEQRLAEHVTTEGAGFTDRCVDDVVIVDPVRIASNQAFHNCNALAFVVELNDVGM